MKKLNLFIATLIGASVLHSSFAWAHAALSASNPGDGAVVNESPETLELHYNEDVRLLKVSMTDTAGAEVDVGFSASGAESAHFSLLLPSLEQGEYIVHWTILGEDTHRVEDMFSFTVDAEAMATPGATVDEQAGHSEHADHNGQH